MGIQLSTHHRLATPHYCSYPPLRYIHNFRNFFLKKFMLKSIGVLPSFLLVRDYFIGGLSIMYLRKAFQEPVTHYLGGLSAYIERIKWFIRLLNRNLVFYQTFLVITLMDYYFSSGLLAYFASTRWFISLLNKHLMFYQP